jgi:EAL domain-containing protein (putative c-di-GMP-specific phosphodiesterase class I)
VRETDTVARLGGDEFAVLATPLAHAEDIEPLADRILSELRRPLELAGTRIQPTASIGAAIFPDSGKDSDTLLSAADAAMYVVKESGRNGVHVHGVELKRRVAHRLMLEQQIRQAIELNEFRLFYQPQVSLAEDFLAAEALLRWLPEGAPVVEAHEFVAILEDTGLILELGPWIIETACQQLRDWRRAGHWVDRVAINISARQVISRDFVPRLLRLTRQAELDCSSIELELTESTLLRDTDQIHAVLEELAGHGYRLALDDFGTGYCSLAYLKNFPISTLKLDRSFVQPMATDPHCRNLVGGIIQLAHRLGLPVVAEGVESREQLELLRSDQCGLLQGYLFGAALPPEEFALTTQRLPWAEGGGSSGLVSRRVPRAPESVQPQRRSGKS